MWGRIGAWREVAYRTSGGGDKDPGRYSHGGGQLLQRIAGLVQLRIPVLKLEKFKLTLHGDPTVLQRQRITAGR